MEAVFSELLAQIVFYVMDGRVASCAGPASCVSVRHQRKGYPRPRDAELCASWSFRSW